MTTLLRAALVVLAVGVLASCGSDSKFDRVVVFGDSLADLGTYAQAPFLAGATAGRYTTNPGQLWPERIARKLDTSIGPNRQGGNTGLPEVFLGGTGYAEGGARVSQQPGVGGTPGGGGFPIESGAKPVRDQISTYLATAGPSRDDLVFIVVGANDVFTQLGLVQQALIDPSGAVQAMATAATELVGEVGRLQAAGVRSIVVTLIPNIALTPFGQLSLDANGRFLLDTLIQTFNDTLKFGLGQLPAGTVVWDSYTLLTEVITNPGAYGLGNTTAWACTTVPLLLTCDGSTLVEPDADQTYVFADPVHPTTGMHRVLAEDAERLLKANDLW